MAGDQTKPIGYLQYQFAPKSGGTPVPGEVAVFSLEHAQKTRELIDKYNDAITFSDFKLVGQDRKTPLQDNSTHQSVKLKKQSRQRPVPKEVSVKRRK